MNGLREHARAWIAKGDNDLSTARLILRGSGPLDTASFHCQQAAEKYLKALVAYAGQPIPRTHNLVLILGECRGPYPKLELQEAEISKLTPYAVELRYDLTFTPDRARIEQAIALAERVRAKVLAVLPSDLPAAQT